MAAILALFAVIAVAAPSSAQVCSGQLVKFDACAYAWETNYTPYISQAGSQLEFVGKVSQFCPPIGLNAADPTKEYTFDVFGLAANAITTVTVLSDRTVYKTRYDAAGPVQFRIYEDNTPDTPANCALPVNPPNAAVPSSFQDGTVLLEGTITGFNTTVTILNSGGRSGVFNSTYAFTGGTLYSSVQSCGGTFGGLWDPAPGIAGYSAHPNGKWDCPATPGLPSTWGHVKTIYR
jgi:hypothetical protein